MVICFRRLVVWRFVCKCGARSRPLAALQICRKPLFGISASDLPADEVFLKWCFTDMSEETPQRPQSRRQPYTRCGREASRSLLKANVIARIWMRFLPPGWRRDIQTWKYPGIGHFKKYLLYRPVEILEMRLSLYFKDAMTHGACAIHGVDWAVTKRDRTRKQAVSRLSEITVTCLVLSIGHIRHGGLWLIIHKERWNTIVILDFGSHLQMALISSHGGCAINTTQETHVQSTCKMAPFQGANRLFTNAHQIPRLTGAFTRVTMCAPGEPPHYKHGWCVSMTGCPLAPRPQYTLPVVRPRRPGIGIRCYRLESGWAEQNAEGKGLRGEPGCGPAISGLP